MSVVKVLILSPYPPYPPYGGGTMRIYQLARGLAQRHDVTVLTFAPSEEAEGALEPMRSFCRVLAVHGPTARSIPRRAWTMLTSSLPDMALRNASRTYEHALRSLLGREPFDIVQAESIEMAHYLEVAAAELRGARQPWGRTAPAGPGRVSLVLDQFNAEYVLQKRAALTSLRAAARVQRPGALVSNLAGGLYSLAQWRKLARFERRVMRGCDAVLAVSEDDRRTLLRLSPEGRVAVVPNGVDTAHFSRQALAGGPPPGIREPALVFTGTLDFRPNVDAVLWFTNEVLPLIRARRPDARLVVVGKRPAAALRRLAGTPGVTIVGEVPDARPYLAAAAVYVVPMRIGGGVRLKLLEALSLAAPVVSTTMGAEGMAGLRPGEHCLLADDPQRFAASVLRLLDDPDLGRRLGDAGRALVRARYDWSAIVPRLEALYTELLACEPAAASTSQ